MWKTTLKDTERYWNALYASKKIYDPYDVAYNSHDAESIVIMET